MRFQPLSLAQHFNTIAATADGERRRGLLNAWGNSLPAEELPFGETVEVAGVPFKLEKEAVSGCDALEPLGQELAIGSAAPVKGLAVLGCGEMGDQVLTLSAVARSGEVRELALTIPGFSVLPGAELGPTALRCTHLHYPGDYDLGLLAGALWCAQSTLNGECGLELERLELKLNPLVRIAALTLEL